MEILQPEGWARPRGFANGIKARGTFIFTGGQIGWDGQCRFHSLDMADQVRQTLANVVEVVRAGGGGPEHIVRMTWYVTDKREYLAKAKEIGAAYREVMGRHFPTMAVVQVAALVEEAARVEIEATAVLPD
ncbi:MAG: RidA family protein [Rhodocyclaceae bacterium]|nr:RidA family protein [Rhodocyclaceae bacterium]